MKRVPVIGETLYSLSVDTSARRLEQRLTPVTVVSVGRKYFECRAENRSWNTKFHIDTWREKTEYQPKERLYETQQEWADEKEAADLLVEIRESIGTYGRKSDLSFDQLKRIASILREMP